MKRDCHKPDFCHCCYKFKYVAVEIIAACAENPDVWGYDGCYSAIIEVKTSHSDFLAGQKKWCRSKEAEEGGFQAGNFRWYLCPEGVIKPDIKVRPSDIILYPSQRGIPRENIQLSTSEHYY